MEKEFKGRKLKVGIIGCGGIAFGKHMPGLAKLESVEMVAFCDPVEVNAKKAAEKYGTDNAKIYGDYNELIEDRSIDIVHVCTSNNTHATFSVAALKAGKHVMCEKPMAITSAEAYAMLEASHSTGKKLSVSYQNRFRPDSLYLKKACDRGDLGEIYFAKAHALRRRAIPTWGVYRDNTCQGGGPLIDIGTHSLDLTLWLMNNYKPKFVVGNVYQKLGKKPGIANAWGPVDSERFATEDSAFGFISMENNATIILESSWALNILQEGEAMTTLCGTEGGADMWDGLTINGENFGKLHTLKPLLGKDGGEAESAGDLEMRLWIECIQNNSTPLVKPEEALAVTRILEGIYKSASSGKPVYLN